MATGKVKFFNEAKGFGFVASEGFEKDVFVHISAVQQAGIDRLTEGQTVEFETEVGNNGKKSATNLKIV